MSDSGFYTPSGFRDECDRLHAELAQARERCEALEGQVAALVDGIHKRGVHLCEKETCKECYPLRVAMCLCRETTRAHDERIIAEATAELRRNLEEYEELLACVSWGWLSNENQRAVLERAIERHRARSEER